MLNKVQRSIVVIILLSMFLVIQHSKLVAAFSRNVAAVSVLNARKSDISGDAVISVCNALFGADRDSWFENSPSQIFGEPLRQAGKLVRLEVEHGFSEAIDYIEMEQVHFLPIYLYVNCVDDMTESQRMFMLQLVDTVISPSMAEVAIAMVGKNNLRISKSLPIRIALYKHLVAKVPDSQLGNLRLSQYYLELGEWDAAIKYAGNAIFFSENRLYTLRGYSVMVRSYVRTNQCELAERYLDEMDTRFANQRDILSVVREQSINLSQQIEGSVCND